MASSCKKNIVIVHYNTPYLTECLVRSINLFMKDAVIYIFDNSDRLPFETKFDNVTVFDNTKGQIINFDKWLENYPNKNKSHGKVNKWGSAKHCYSVEKCMQLIDGNFVLLDSDVLLKRDISNLFREDLIYIGSIITQPLSSIKRVLPFICYINNNMCKKKKVHFFNDNYMHGLYKTVKADKYDTGAWFYINCEKLPFEKIKHEDYVIHYGHGSWNKAGEKLALTKEQWLLKYKKYWSMEKNKKVLYTCITGGYDTLSDPDYITKDFDYVCFTDNPNITSDVWIIKPLPKETDGLSSVKKQRCVKINPHLFLSEYDVSIWVDGNVAIKGDLNKFLDKNLTDDCSVYVPKHPFRNCIYEEARVVVKIRKDKEENVKPQIERYKKEGFPEKFGLLQSNIMIRKHNNEDCIKLMEAWFQELKDGSHRDQLSFNYALWKNQNIKVVYMDKLIYKSEFFKWNGIHKKNKSQAVSIGNYSDKPLSPARKNDRITIGRLNRIKTSNIPIYSQ